MRANTLTVSDRDRAAAARIAEELGDRAAARALGLDLASFLRILLGRRVRTGTVVLLRMRLAQLAGGGDRWPGGDA